MSLLEQSLYEATRKDDISQVRDLLKRHPGLKVNWKDHGGSTCLHIACAYGFQEILQMFLHHPQMSVNQKDVYGSTAFYLACSNGRAGVVPLLLRDSRVQLNEPDDNGCSPFWWACYKGHVDVVKWFIACGREVEWDRKGKYYNEYTPLDAAEKANRTEVITLLKRVKGNLDELRREVRSQLKTLGEYWRFPLVQYEAGGELTSLLKELKEDSGVGLMERRLFDSIIFSFWEIEDCRVNYDLAGFDISLCSPSLPRLCSKDSSTLTFLTTTRAPQTSLSKSLGLPLNSLVVSVPETFFTVEEVTYVSLASSNLTSLPERLVSFVNLVELDLSGNPLSAEEIATIIKNNKTVRSFSFRDINLGPAGVLTVLQALVFNFAQGNFVLESLAMQDVKLDSIEGLGMIPADILEQGSGKIVEFLLDLYRSPEADPVYRSKLMVVGFEGVGKTTILDCLFPIEEVFTTRSLGILKTDSYVVLQGCKLSRYKGTSAAADATPELDVVLENRQWEVAPIPSRPLAIKLTPKKKGDDSKEIELNCATKESYEAWLARLKRVCMNEATHGIEIQSLRIDNATTQEYFDHKGVSKGARGKRTLDLSVWDFAGQHGYYNNHHYFLTTRTVFMVLWNLSDPEDKAFKGLEFWFRSLATHLSPTSTPPLNIEGLSDTFFSIIVVGTYLDHPSVRRDERNKRAQVVDRLAAECGLTATPPQYFEVSCSASLENIDILQEAILKTAVSHTYMGERVPQSYLRIQALIQRLRAEKKDLPLIPIDELVKEVGTLQLAKRALGLLSLWGECVYFESPAELASVVILDPRFLTKGILADLFNHDQNTKGMRKDGVVKHSALAYIWSRFKNKDTTPEEFSALCVTFMALLEKLGVCFVVSEDRKWNKSFMEQRSIIPALLPEKPADPLPRDPDYPSKFQQVWPAAPPHFRPVQIERVLKFTVLPTELVSRLLVHVHPHIQEGLLWKNEVVIIAKEAESAQAWVRVEQKRRRFVIVIRGGDHKECQRFLRFIVARVKEVMGVGETKYSSVKWEEAVTSPHDPAADISLQEAEVDAARQPQDRTLTCPESRLPIRAEKILQAAGLPIRFPREKGPWWWNTAPKSPTAAADLADRRLLRLVAERGAKDKQARVVDQEAHVKFQQLFSHLGGDLAQVTRVFVVDNPRLRSAFEAQRHLYSQSAPDVEGLMQRNDWRQAPNAEARRALLHHLAAKIAKFRSHFNDGSRAFVVPVVQATTEKAAFKIAKTGFGSVATLPDGPYGQGIYFTSRMDHAARQAKPSGTVGKPFFIALALPGHPYPVVVSQADEAASLVGSSCRKGYQSHYVELTAESKPAHIGDQAVADELVCFDGAQTLPFFLVYTTTEFNSSPHGELTKQWSFLDQGEVTTLSQLEDLRVSPEELQEVAVEEQGHGVDESVMTKKENEELRALVDSANERIKKLQEENAVQAKQISGLTRDVEELKKAFSQLRGK